MTRAESVARFLQPRLPDLDLRVLEEGDSLVVRYAAAARRGRRFPVLFTIRFDGTRWIADRELDRGVIGETIEFLSLS